MNPIFKAIDIVWIKHVTHPSHSMAVYMEHSEGEKFILDLPKNRAGRGDRKNLMRPAMDTEIILLYQVIDGKRNFSHLVIPIDSASHNEIVHTGNNQYPIGRWVNVYKKKLIPVADTLWDTAWFKGPGHGRFCKIEKIKNIVDRNTLLQDIWDRFHAQ